MGQKDTGLWRPFISAAHIVQISGLLQHTSNGIRSNPFNSTEFRVKTPRFKWLS